MPKNTANTTTFNWMIMAGLVFSLTGCLGSNTRPSTADVLPEWVTSPPQDPNHLYGVGSAPRIENMALAFTQAEQNGNAQIAQQLRTQVSQVSTQDTQVRSGQGGEQVSKIQTAYTQVATAPIELEQAVNEQRYAAQNYVYALQSIDRRRIISKLKLALNDTDEQIRQQASLLKGQQNQTPITENWQTYMRLVPYFAQRHSYEDELNLYSTSATSLGKADPDIQAIENRLNSALSYYGFDTQGSAQADHLSSALSAFGLTPKSGSIFKLNSRTEQHSETQDGRIYVFEDGTLELIGPNNERLATWTVSARGISKTLNKAKEQASMQWSKQAVEAMFTWLTRLD